MNNCCYVLLVFRFVVQTTNGKKFINAIKTVMEKAHHRQNPRLLFFPRNISSSMDKDFSQTIFNEATNFMPDILVMDTSHYDSG